MAEGGGGDRQPRGSPELATGGSIDRRRRGSPEPVTWPELLPAATLAVAGGDGWGRKISPAKISIGREQNLPKLVFFGSFQKFLGS